MKLDKVEEDKRLFVNFVTIMTMNFRMGRFHMYGSWFIGKLNQNLLWFSDSIISVQEYKDFWANTLQWLMLYAYPFKGYIMMIGSPIP